MARESHHTQANLRRYNTNRVHRAPAQTHTRMSNQYKAVQVQTACRPTLCSLHIQHGGDNRRSSNNKTPGRRKANNLYARTSEQQLCSRHKKEAECFDTNDTPITKHNTTHADTDKPRSTPHATQEIQQLSARHWQSAAEPPPAPAAAPPQQPDHPSPHPPHPPPPARPPAQTHQQQQQRQASAQTWSRLC